MSHWRAASPTVMPKPAATKTSASTVVRRAISIAAMPPADVPTSTRGRGRAATSGWSEAAISKTLSPGGIGSTLAPIRPATGRQVRPALPAPGMTAKLTFTRERRRRSG